MTIKEMVCHVWALSGNVDEASAVHIAYTEVSNKIGATYDYGRDLQGKTMANVREDSMIAIAKIHKARTKLLDHDVYLCGGFGEGAVCPEHMWLEDHTINRTFDTFEGRDVVAVDRVGEKGKPFKPGCEHNEFPGDRIVRVLIKGYTVSQVETIGKSKDSSINKFPPDPIILEYFSSRRR